MTLKNSAKYLYGKFIFFNDLVDVRSKKIKKNLMIDPLNGQYHFDLAQYSFKKRRYFLAFSELKSAEYLGYEHPRLNFYKEQFLNRLPPLESLNHNRYYRLKSLSNRISEILVTDDNSSKSILDVGGGQGLLAGFLPKIRYVLAEPRINHINGLTLPFDDDQFDLVVSCHVLEHIPVTERDDFLENLVRKGRRGLLLLNPIETPGTNPEKRLQLVYEITKENWAKEHLECSLPKLEDIEQFAKERDLRFHYSPNGTYSTSLAMVFLDHLKFHLGKRTYEKINRFYNTEIFDKLDSDKDPTAGMIFLEKPALN